MNAITIPLDQLQNLHELRALQKKNGRFASDLRARAEKEDKLDQWLKENYKPEDKQVKMF